MIRKLADILPDAFAVLASAALALLAAAGIFACLGTSWPVRALAAWVAFCVAVYPVLDDVIEGMERLANQIDGVLRRLS
jgi:hypothetical protein